MSKRYIYISREQAKRGVSCVFKVADEPVQNMAEYFEGKACLYIGEDLPHFITYLPELDTIREATEEEKLARQQRTLAENELLIDGKIVSYDPYSQKVIDGNIVEKTRENYIEEGLITLETEKAKARMEREKVFNALDLYDKAVLRGDIEESVEGKAARDSFREEWLELPNNYNDLSIDIESLYPTLPAIIAYFA
ncbi:hypothetical protein M2102_001277 [Fusobacterium sp. PH5-7]|uniref:hypothetical protein n=1 Tax=Fusobacterium sp. PH5-7 TaxID=2940528 RepID=UPI0024739011|nr:hypothetical protein [Fusobacterium sp. PH5-7]MDH6457649.1 hypothetical protein [Fusobacterium sp. PH5-7]